MISRYARTRSCIGLTALLLLCIILQPSSLAAADQRLSRPIAPGVVYERIHRDDGPREIRVLRMDRDVSSMSLQAAVGQGTVRGVERLNGMIERAKAGGGGTIVAAVNADFFTMAGHPHAGLPSGACVARGEVLVTARRQLAFMIDDQGTPAIGDVHIKGQVTAGARIFPIGSVNDFANHGKLRIHTSRRGWPAEETGILLQVDGLPLKTAGQWQGRVLRRVPAGQSITPAADQLLLVPTGDSADILDAVAAGETVEIRTETPGVVRPLDLAVGGGPLLLRDGQVAVGDDPKAPRHPRTAIGFNAEEIVLVTVDGRQPGWAVGMTLHQLAMLMAELGCTEALNLDGGGSTTCWVRGETVNRPSDGGQRLIANALLVRSEAPSGPLSRIMVQPDSVTAFPGTSVPVDVICTDDWYNPVAPPAAGLAVEVENVAGGNVSARWRNGLLEFGPGTGQARVSLHPQGTSEASASLEALVISSCDSITLSPDPLVLAPGSTGLFELAGSVGAAHGIPLPAERLTWTVHGRGVRLLRENLFQAAAAGSVSRVTVRLGETSASASIAVTEDVTVDAMDSLEGVQVSRYPAEGEHGGSADVQTVNGRTFARLRFDLGQPKGTRAVYLRFDRDVGRVRSIAFDARSTGQSPWLRLAVRGGTNQRQTLTASSRLDPESGWQRCRVRIPATMAQPVTLESIYVVETAGRTCRGTLDIDALTVERIPHTAAVDEE